MPNARNPELKDWVNVIDRVVKQPDANVTLVGHSLGCFALLHYLRRLDSRARVGKLILVSGFKMDRGRRLHRYYLTDHDFNKIRRIVRQIYCIYSDNDRVVTPRQTQLLNEKLGGQLIVEHDKGHFSNLKLATLPIVYELITIAQRWQIGIIAYNRFIPEGPEWHIVSLEFRGIWLGTYERCFQTYRRRCPWASYEAWSSSWIYRQLSSDHHEGKSILRESDLGTAWRNGGWGSRQTLRSSRCQSPKAGDGWPNSGYETAGWDHHPIARAEQGCNL